MDRDRFDALTRRVTVDGISRRGAVRLLAAGALAALIPHEGTAGAANRRCVALGKACNGEDRCCDGDCRRGECRCPRGSRPCGGRCCPSDRSCQDGVCRCMPDRKATTCRDGRCVRSQFGTDCMRDDNCCSNHCAAGNGDCPRGRTRCGGRCVNTNTDDANCGGRGNACAPDAECMHGVCMAGRRPGGRVPGRPGVRLRCMLPGRLLPLRISLHQRRFLRPGLRQPSLWRPGSLS